MRACLALCLALVACGDDPSEPSDGGQDAPSVGDAAEDAAIVEVTPPAPPAPPAPPVLTPCPAGFTEETTEGGAVYCAPPPHVECEGATAQRTGDVDCTPIGAPCPEGDFAEDLPDDAVYLLAGAPADGDGTREHPYGNAQLALLDASGGTLAVGKGTYTVRAGLSGDVRIEGACASETVFVSGPSDNPLDVFDDELVVRNMTLRGGPEAVSSFDGRVTLEGVVLEEGVAATYGGTLTLRDVVVRDAPPGSVAGVICLDAECTLEHVAIHVVEVGGVSVDAGQMTATDVRIVGSGMDDSREGLGLVVVSGGEAVFSRVIVEGMTQGADVGWSSTAELSDAYFERLQRGAIGVHDGATITLERFSGFAVGAVSLAATTEGVLHGTDLLLVQGDAGPASAGTGILDATIDLTRVWIEAASNVTMALGRTEMRANDLTVLNGAGYGAGIVCTEGTSLAIDRARLASLRGTALAALTGSSVTLRDVAIDDVRSVTGEASGGHAIDVQPCDPTMDACDPETTIVTLERVEVTGASGAAISALGVGARVEGVDLRVSHTQPDGEMRFGRALQVVEGATIDVARAWLEDSREYAIMSYGGSSLALSDLTVDGARASACEGASCPEATLGVGLGLYMGNATLTRFVIRDAELCGLHLALDADITLANGAIEDSAVGVCAEQEGFDPRAASSELSFRNNGTDLQTMRLPVPSISQADVRP